MAASAPDMSQADHRGFAGSNFFLRGKPPDVSQADNQGCAGGNLFFMSSLQKKKVVTRKNPKP